MRKILTKRTKKKILTFDNHVNKSKDIFDKQWGISIPKSVEETIFLDMLEFITRSTSSQLEEEISITNAGIRHEK